MIIPAVKKTFDKRVVLDTPDFDLNEDCINAVIGSNGSGKSTFARILAGCLDADDSVSIHGLRIGYLPQKSYPFRMSVRKNVLLGGNDTKKADRLIDSLGLSPLADKSGHTLSGGETARMCLARVLMRDYDLLILDEPTAAMDMSSILLAEKLLTDYAKQGNTVLIITHSVQQASRIADNILFFKDGRIVEKGPKSSVLHTPEKPETKEFLDFFGTVV